MKQNTAISVVIIGAITILFTQGFWLNSMYSMYREDISKQIFSDFKLAIEKELGIRSSSKYKGKILEVTPAEAMTPEQRAKYKGDTINLDSAAAQNIGKSFSEVFSQISQNSLIKKKKYINLCILDSIYSELLQKQNIKTRFYFTLFYNKEKRIETSADTTDFSKNNILKSDTQPIGTKGLQSIQVSVELPPHVILNRMRTAFIVSCLAIFLVLGCLTYQLIVIRRKDRLLKQREQAVNGTIHDLKSPLAGVYTMLSYFSSDETEEDKKELLAEAKIRVKRLCETIESLLSVAKNNRQRLLINRTEVNLPQLINIITNDMKVCFPEKQFTIQTDNRLTGTTIYADAGYMENALRNLIENALKYSDEGVKVDITLAESGKGTTISIKDNGWGIPEKAQRRIFTMFYQVPRKRMVKGYGIGLSYVKRIINEHGGKINFTSREGEGTTFFIILPPEKNTNNGGYKRKKKSIAD